MNFFKSNLCILSFVVFLFISCKEIPTDPMEDYDRVTVTINSANTIDTVKISDSARVLIRLQNPHLIDSIILTFNNLDTVLKCVFPEEKYDSLIVKHLFSTTGNIVLTYSAKLKNRDSISGVKSFYIAGIKPSVVSQSGPLFLLRSADACTLKVSVSGTLPLSYQWKKGTTINTTDTLSTLIFSSLSAKDTGTYTCTVTNSWGSVSSTPSTIVLREQNKKVYWNFGTYRDSVYTGDSLKLSLTSLYTRPSMIPVALSKVTPDLNSEFIGDSLLIFRSSALAAGTYSILSIIQSSTEKDTAQILITVLPKIFSLTLKADSGSITVSPVKESYIPGDTVILKAVPKTGFIFSGWSGITAPNVDSIKVAMTASLNIQAIFIPIVSGTDIVFTQGKYLNNLIQTYSESSQRPKTFTLAPGVYTAPKIRIYGKVKINIQ